ncbi:hypothetical protein D3C81_2054260 [compost metagenome]
MFTRGSRVKTNKLFEETYQSEGFQGVVEGECYWKENSLEIKIKEGIYTYVNQKYLQHN